MLDKYRNLFDHKYSFYTDQINKRIIPKLLEDFAKKAESQDIVKDLKGVWELASDVSEGTYDVEDTYNDELKNILKNKIENHHKGLLEGFKVEELAIYHLVHLGAGLELIFDNNKYLTKDLIKNKLVEVEKESREGHLKSINALKKLLK